MTKPKKLSYYYSGFKIADSEPPGIRRAALVL